MGGSGAHLCSLLVVTGSGAGRSAHQVRAPHQLCSLSASSLWRPSTVGSARPHRPHLRARETKALGRKQLLDDGVSPSRPRDGTRRHSPCSVVTHRTGLTFPQAGLPSPV